MEQVLIITDSTSGNAFAVITEKAGSLRFYGMSEPGKEWSKWLDSQTGGRGRLDQIVKKLSIGLTADGPKPMSRKIRAEFAENLPKTSDSNREELITGRVDSKSIANNFSRTGKSSSQWNAQINYKALSFIGDQNHATIAYDLKAARAIFDPNLADGNGGYRCPPGVRYGGQITDRYGRGCGFGVARRIVNAIGDAAQRLEVRLDDRRKRRVDRRNARVGRRIGVDKPGRSRRGIATRLDNFADRRDRRQGRGIATRLDDFADRRDERQGISPRRRRGTDSPPAVARRRRGEELVDEPTPETARERRRSASVDRVNGQPTAAKKPATVPVAERKRPVKKVAAKKRAVKKVPAKKAAAKKVAAKKAPAKKIAARPAKKAAARRRADQENVDPASFSALSPKDQAWVKREFLNGGVNTPEWDKNRQQRVVDGNLNFPQDNEPSWTRLRNIAAANERLAGVQRGRQERRDLSVRERVLARELADRHETAAKAYRDALAAHDAGKNDKVPSVPVKKVSARKTPAKRAAARPPVTPPKSSNTRIPNYVDLSEEDQRWALAQVDARHRGDALRIDTRLNEPNADFKEDIKEGERQIEELRKIQNDRQLEDRVRVVATGRITRIENNNLRFLDAIQNGPPNAAGPTRPEGAEKRPAGLNAPTLYGLDETNRAKVRARIQAVYGEGGGDELESDENLDGRSIERLKASVASLEERRLPRLAREYLDENLPDDDRVFAFESAALERERLARFRRAIERKNAPPKAPEVQLTPEQRVKLEKEVGKRYSGLRKKRAQIIGKYMVKRYGNEDPPPWKTDKNLSLQQLRTMADNGWNPEDKQKAIDWIKAIYGHEEIVGRNGMKFRTVVEEPPTIGQRTGGVNGKIQAFNTQTGEWEQVGKFTRTIFWNDAGHIKNNYLMMGKQAGFDNPFAESAKNEGFTSIFNPHAFTWFKAAGFEDVEVSAAADGLFVWGRSGFRQDMTVPDFDNAGNNIGPRGEVLAKALAQEVKRFKDGAGSDIIRTDLDADMISYLVSTARARDFAIDAPQHPEYILALAGDKNLSETEKKEYDAKLQAWFIAISPFTRGEFLLNDENVPDDPRKLL